MASTVAEGGLVIPGRTRGWLERRLGTDTYRMLRRLARNPLSVAGGVIMVLFIFIALAAPVLAPPVRANVDPAMIPKDGTGDDPRAPGSVWSTENVPPRPFWYEAIIGRDHDEALAIVVHPSNPVDALTLQHLSDIYSGKITNWQQVGGEDRTIVALSLKASSNDIYNFFMRQVLRMGQEGSQVSFASAVQKMAAAEIAAEVRRNPGAIGYYGLGNETKDQQIPQEEKVLAIARSADEPAVMPSLATVRDGSYPIVRERWIHIMGTAPKQYDIWYGVVWGTRTAFLVGLVITAATALIGVTIGSISAFYGRAVDMVLMRVTDVFLSFPFLVAALTLSAILSPVIGKSLYPPMIALTAFGWMGYSRLIRSDILSIREREYVLAARVVGVPDSRIIFRHILPNAIFPTLVVASMDIGSYVLSFAGLSFLGVGVEEGYADWGQLLSFTRDWIVGMKTAPNPYIIIYPGLALLFFVLAWNLVGDALRDVLDPRMRGTRA